MGNPAITRASVRKVLEQANGRPLSTQQICGELRVAWDLDGAGWQNVCEIIFEATRLTELGIAKDRPCIGWSIDPPRAEAAHG